MLAYVGAALGTVTLAFLFRVPRRALFAGTVLGVLAFWIYNLTKTQQGSEHLAVFLGAAVGALLGELLARRMRMAAIVFITPSLLPLVPGLGLYRTMLYVVQGDMGAAAALGADTLITLGLLAVAVATATLFMRLIWVLRKA